MIVIILYWKHLPFLSDRDIFETILLVEKVQIWYHSIYVVYNIGPY